MKKWQNLFLQFVVPGSICLAIGTYLYLQVQRTVAGPIPVCEPEKPEPSEPPTVSPTRVLSALQIVTVHVTRGVTVKRLYEDLRGTVTVVLYCPVTYAYGVDLAKEHLVVSGEGHIDLNGQSHRPRYIRVSVPEPELLSWSVDPSAVREVAINCTGLHTRRWAGITQKLRAIEEDLPRIVRHAAHQSDLLEAAREMTRARIRDLLQQILGEDCHVEVEFREPGSQAPVAPEKLADARSAA